jgi:hypothetical protein
MKTRSRRTIPLVLVAAVAAFLLPAAVATAQPVGSGTVTMVSDPGDFVGGGLSYVFSTEDGDVVNAHSTLGRTVTVGVRGVNDQGFEEFFDLEFDAPGNQPLVPGTYANATRYPFNARAASLPCGARSPSPTHQPPTCSSSGSRWPPTAPSTASTAGRPCTAPSPAPSRSP